MLLLALGTFLFACGYAGVLFFIYRGWKRLPVLPDSIPDYNPPFISVVIAARNEENSITTTLESLSLQTYPKDRYEIIVIDDHSEDETAHLIQVARKNHPNIRYFSLVDHLPPDHQTVAYKKAALQLGIDQARGEYIITTDADCTFPPDWLRSYALAFHHGSLMVLAPVQLWVQGNFLQNFQALDVAGTMMLTGAAVGWGHPLLANGANMGFQRSFFYELGEYTGNEHRASGDDIFLLQKAVQQAPDRIQYLTAKSAIVSTEPASSWTAFFHQRLRWAAKTSAYKDPLLVLFQGFVYLLCLLLLVLPLAAIISGNLMTGFLMLGAWLLKIMADLFFLRFACHFFQQPQWMRHFIPAQFVHVLYIYLIGTLAIFPIRVNWKNRRSR